MISLQVTFELAGVRGNTKFYEPLAKSFQAVNFTRWQSFIKIIVVLNLLLWVLPKKCEKYSTIISTPSSIRDRRSLDSSFVS